jgi:uncharacterized protein YndB with AHSA1/START domain
MIADEETTLLIKRTFNASAEDVFEAWLTLERWQAWIGPEGMNCKVTLLEPRVGGRYRIDMRALDGSLIPVSGQFEVIDRPRALSFTWGWDGDPTRQSLVTFNSPKSTERRSSRCDRKGCRLSKTGASTSTAGTARWQNWNVTWRGQADMNPQVSAFGWVPPFCSRSRSRSSGLLGFV